MRYKTIIFMLLKTFTPHTFWCSAAVKGARYSILAILVTMIPKSLWALDYTDQLIFNGRFADIVNETNKNLRNNRSNSADYPNSQRYAQCDAERRKCTECLTEPGVDGVACHFACEDGFNRCMTVEGGTQRPESSVGGSAQPIPSDPLITKVFFLAEQGDIDAQFWAAKLYYLGVSVERDQDKGFKWLKKSAFGGNEGAKKLFSLIEPLEYGSVLSTIKERQMYDALTPTGRTQYLSFKKQQRDERIDTLVREFVRSENQ